MKFMTIWTMPAMALTERLRRTRDWASREFAARLPRRVRYWVFMLEAGRATRNSPNIPATTLDELLQNLDCTPR